MIRHGSPPYLECSSKGDKRFSAFHARLTGRGGRSIEELYQAAKVFQTEGPWGVEDVTGLPWRLAKGKAAVNHVALRALYSQLWDEYLAEHPELLPVLTAAAGLSDVFGQPGHACQATELWRLRCAALGVADMRLDLQRTDLAGRLGYLREESAELIGALADIIKTVEKLTKFGPRATDPKTSITYDNVQDIVDATVRAQAEIADVQHAISAARIALLTAYPPQPKETPA